MNPTVLILIALAAAAVLAGVAFVVMGKGGQLARFEADHPPLDLPTDRPLNSEDVHRVTLPLAFWGYHVRAVDTVLHRLTGALNERDARIAELERRLAESTGPAGPAGTSVHGPFPARADDDTDDHPGGEEPGPSGDGATAASPPPRTT